MTQPEMTIFAGPSGSGKSTIVSRDPNVDYFNYDERCRQLNGGSSHNIPQIVKDQAGQDFKAFINSHLEQKKTFSFETTLRTEKELQQVREARRLGFKTKILFVSTDNVEINIARVKGRFKGGYHAGSDRYIRETHDKAPKNLSDICKEVDYVDAFDNSSGKIPVFSIEHGKLTYLNSEAPAWAIESLERAGLVQGKDFQKYQISVTSKEDFKKYNHNVYVSKESWKEMDPKDKEAHLKAAGLKFVGQHPALAKQNSADLQISIKPALTKELTKGPVFSK